MNTWSPTASVFSRAVGLEKTSSGTWIDIVAALPPTADDVSSS